jgi:hypothetical protein
MKTIGSLGNWRDYVEIIPEGFAEELVQRFEAEFSNIFQKHPKVVKTIQEACQKRGCKIKVIIGSSEVFFAHSPTNEIEVDPRVIGKEFYMGEDGRLHIQPVGASFAHEIGHLNCDVSAYLYERKKTAARFFAHGAPEFDEDFIKKAVRITNRVNAATKVEIEQPALLLEAAFHTIEGMPTRRIYENAGFLGEYSLEEVEAMVPKEFREEISKAKPLSKLSYADRMRRTREKLSSEFGAFNPVPEAGEDGVSPAISDMGGIKIPPSSGHKR